MKFNWINLSKAMGMFLLKTSILCLTMLACFQYLILSKPNITWKAILGWCIIFFVIDIWNWLRTIERGYWSRVKVKAEKEIMYFDTLMVYESNKKKYGDIVDIHPERHFCRSVVGVKDTDVEDGKFICYKCREHNERKR